MPLRAAFFSFEPHNCGPWMPQPSTRALFVSHFSELHCTASAPLCNYQRSIPMSGARRAAHGHVAASCCLRRAPSGVRESAPLAAYSVNVARHAVCAPPHAFDMIVGLGRTLSPELPVFIVLRHMFVRRSAYPGKSQIFFFLLSSLSGG